MNDETTKSEEPASKRELSVFSREIAEQIGDWIAQGQQYAQQEQADEPYWDHVCAEIREYLDRAHDIGWHAAAHAAITVCNVRAERGDDIGTPRSNEAAKCGLQIEAVLVTHTMTLPREYQRDEKLPAPVGGDEPECPHCGTVHEMPKWVEQYHTFNCDCGWAFQAERETVIVSRPLEYREWTKVTGLPDQRRNP